MTNTAKPTLRITALFAAFILAFSVGFAAISTFPVTQALALDESTPVATVKVALSPTNGKAKQTLSTTQGSTFGSLKISKPAKKGYTFLGWFTGKTNGTKYTSSTVISGNVTLYAHWKITHPVKVKFSTRGGYLDKKSVTLPKNAALGKHMPSRYGYVFKGWYTKKSGGTKVTSKTKITKSRTLYAHWKADMVKVKFDANGGHFTSGSKTRTKQVGKAIGTLPKVSKKGYRCIGWYPYDKKGGYWSSYRLSKTSSAYKTRGNSLVLKARWVKKGSGSTVTLSEWNVFKSNRNYDLTYSDVKAIFGGSGQYHGYYNGYPSYRWYGPSSYGYSGYNKVTLGFTKASSSGLWRVGQACSPFSW